MLRRIVLLPANSPIILMMLQGCQGLRDVSALTTSLDRSEKCQGVFHTSMVLTVLYSKSLLSPSPRCTPSAISIFQTSMHRLGKPNAYLYMII